MHLSYKTNLSTDKNILYNIKNTKTVSKQSSVSVLKYRKYVRLIVNMYVCIQMLLTNYYST